MSYCIVIKISTFRYIATFLNVAIYFPYFCDICYRFLADCTLVKVELLALL